ncbi:MAG: serine hydroxymethyltransferase, partial [Alphaproteobacteria bacterium]
MSVAHATAGSGILERFFNARLAETDADVYKAIRDELRRQQEQIELIASENIASQAVIDAM